MNFADLVQRQRAHFDSGATRPREARLENLRRLRDLLLAGEAGFLAALHADLRKPALEAYSAEIALVLGEIRHAQRHLKSWMKPRPARAPWLALPARASVAAEPRGVALIIGPWNYPLQLLLSPLVGALAAGCCAVLKPSEFAPHTSALVARQLRAAFPDTTVAVVEGEREVSEALLRERFDTIFFTGSSHVGRSVMAAAARHLTPVTLELGGKCPAIVCADAPPEVAARRIAWGKFMNAGQTCVAPDFVLVDHRVAERFLDALRTALRQFYGGDPQQSADYGRIVNRRHFDRLTALLAGRSIAHGGRSDAADLYLEPTVLTDVPWDAPVLQEEIFGPILPVVPFPRLDEAMARLRERPTPLALYLFTADRATQQLVMEGTRSGGVCLNDTIVHMLGQGLPFGGLGESGMGAYHGRASFDAFTHERAILRRPLFPDPLMRYPPPRLSRETMKKAMRFLLGG